MSDPDLIDGLLKKGPPHLGIQYNNIGYPECEIIAEKLRNNETITTLNISGNDIGDAGAKVLSRSILFNKKLAALSMQNCNLSDRAARDLAAVLSRRVEMEKDEIVRWRKSRMELIVASNSQLQLTIQPTKQKRPGSEHSSQTGKESGRKNKRQTVHEKPEKGGKGAGKRKSNSNVVENKGTKIFKNLEILLCHDHYVIFQFLLRQKSQKQTFQTKQGFNELMEKCIHPEIELFIVSIWQIIR